MLNKANHKAVALELADVLKVKPRFNPDEGYYSFWGTTVEICLYEYFAVLYVGNQRLEQVDELNFNPKVAARQLSRMALRFLGLSFSMAV